MDSGEPEWKDSETAGSPDTSDAEREGEWSVGSSGNEEADGTPENLEWTSCTRRVKGRVDVHTPPDTDTRWELVSTFLASCSGGSGDVHPPSTRRNLPGFPASRSVGSSSVEVLGAREGEDTVRDRESPYVDFVVTDPSWVVPALSPTPSPSLRDVSTVNSVRDFVLTLNRPVSP